MMGMGVASQLNGIRQAGAARGMVARLRQARGVALVAVAGIALSACGSGAVVGTTGGSISGVKRTYQRGYVLSEGALDQIPVGSSQEQVLLVLGTPSTVAVVNGEVFYYISQTQERIAFLKPQVTDQKVLAVYFDKNKRVERIAQYGKKDGKVFDFVSQTTPTSGEELSLLRQMIGLVTFD